MGDLVTQWNDEARNKVLQAQGLEEQARILRAEAAQLWDCAGALKDRLEREKVAAAHEKDRER